jgi:hypothetical protein
MVSIEGGSKHRLKGTNWKWGKCRLWRGNVQNGVAAYKFLGDKMRRSLENQRGMGKDLPWEV